MRTEPRRAIIDPTRHTVRGLTDDDAREVADLFRWHVIEGCRGADIVRTEAIVVVYEGDAAIAAGEIRWGPQGIAGLNRMAVKDAGSLADLEQEMLGYAASRRPPWVDRPQWTPEALGVAA